MDGRTDDLLAIGAIAAGGGIAVALTAALFLAWSVPATPEPARAASLPGAPARPPAVAPQAPTPPAAPRPPSPPAPPLGPRPPIGFAPIPDPGRERTVVRRTVIADVRAETPGAIRFAVIRREAPRRIPDGR